MSTTSRRAVLAGIAAAVPAAPALASFAHNPDAELLNLGEQLNRVIADYNAQQLIDRERGSAYSAEVERVTGIARKDAPDPDWENPAWVAYYEAQRAVGKAIFGSDPDIDSPWAPIHDRLYPIARAQTIAGLAVQARAVVMAMAELWDGGGEGQERVFIEAVCAFVGVAPEQLLLLCEPVENRARLAPHCSARNIELRG